MKRVTAAAITLGSLCLATALLSAAAPAAVHARAGTLLPVKFGLPFALSGQPYLYSVASAATGGTKPYRCTPKVLDVGSLKLGSNCEITGTAPVVSIKSVTGPFTFKLTDSSKPPKTVTLYPLDFTTIAKAKPKAPPTLPAVPAGWQLVKSERRDFDLPEFGATIHNPQSLAINIILAKNAHDAVVYGMVDCGNGLGFTLDPEYTHPGLHVIRIPPPGETSCHVGALGSVSGFMTVQILAKTGTAPTSGPTPTPAPTPAPSAHAFDGVWNATFTGTLNGGSSYYPATPCCAGPIVMVVNNAYIDPSYSGSGSAGYGLGTVGNIASNGDATMHIDALRASNLSYSSGLGGCQFQAHFTTSGTADSVGTVSCQGGTFTGTFHAVRTSHGP